MGYSTELWLTSPLVVTPPPVPKGSDDTAKLILNMSDVYFSFYGAPSKGHVLPTDLASTFKPGQISLGVFSTVNGQPTTSVYGVQAFNSNGATVPQWTGAVVAVPELDSMQLMLAGLLGMGWVVRRRQA